MITIPYIIAQIDLFADQTPITVIFTYEVVFFNYTKNVAFFLFDVLCKRADGKKGDTTNSQLLWIVQVAY